jgi:hypothetical protein
LETRPGFAQNRKASLASVSSWQMTAKTADLPLQDYSAAVNYAAQTNTEKQKKKTRNDE